MQDHVKPGELLEQPKGQSAAKLSVSRNVQRLSKANSEKIITSVL